MEHDRHTGGGGWMISEVMYTLNTTEVHAVAYNISSHDSNSMKSSNPYSGVYETETAKTLAENGGDPSCHQGGTVIVERHSDPT